MISRKSAYTLVEILVVAAVLAILAAIISAAVVGARAAGKKTSCLSNLRQIGAALHMYAADHDGYAPPYATRPVKQGAVTKVHGDSMLWRDSLFKYSGSNGIFYCPADAHAGTDFVENCADRDHSLYTSYETTPFVGIEIDQDKRVIVSVDNPKFENMAYLQDRVCMSRNLKTGEWDMTSHHGATGSVLFLDNHVEHITVTDK